MLFNSYIFLVIFLPVTVVFYAVMKRCSPLLGKLAIIIASLAFYGYWDLSNLPVLLFSIFFNFGMGQFVSGQSRHRKRWLILGVAVNIAILCYYKYLFFFCTVLSLDFVFAKIALPLAISFFTFEQISYLFDQYRGLIKEKSFVNYAFFITFFPRLLAGPIYYYREYQAQISQACHQAVSWHTLSKAITLFSFALFKKVMIADKLSVLSNKLYSAAPLSISTPDAWVGSFAYTLQIYFDFSAYSEMALALGLLFGLHLPVNFYSPYQATSLIDFWRRWHMSLSRFIRDYIYVPLSGNRSGQLLQYRNLLVAMTIAGLWHGAGWTFIVWGFLHGSLLVVNHLFSRSTIVFPTIINWLLTFLAVHFLWVFFRASTMQQAFDILEKLVSFDGLLGCTYTLKQIFLCGAALLMSLLMPNLIQMIDENSSRLKWQPNILWGLSTIIIFYLAFLELSHVSEFLYFNF